MPRLLSELRRLSDLHALGEEELLRAEDVPPLAAWRPEAREIAADCDRDEHSPPRMNAQTSSPASSGSFRA